MPGLRIWSNQKFDTDHAQRLRAAVGPHSVVWATRTSASNLVAGERDSALSDCHIAYGQPDPNDVAAARELRLICLSSAGYTRYDTASFREICKSKQIIVCNASGVYDEPCAQHVLAMMLGISRQVPLAVQNQLGPKSWPYLPIRSISDLLDEKTHILLVGYGAIAKRLCELLAPFRSKVIAFRRNVRGDELCPTHPIDQLDSFTPEADHVVNILPLTNDTTGFFDADRFAKFKPGSRFYNIGRGDTVDQDALIGALNRGQLASAYLDVTSPEPLPSDHPLWTTANCHIFPHTGGGTHDEADRQIAHFAENVKRFERGEELCDRIF